MSDIGSAAGDQLNIYYRAALRTTSLKETIARRHPECRVVIHLKPTADAAAHPGREYWDRADAELRP